MSGTSEPMSLINKITAVLTNHHMNVNSAVVTCACAEFWTVRGSGSDEKIARHHAEVLVNAGLMNHEEPEDDEETVEIKLGSGETVRASKVQITQLCAAGAMTGGWSHMHTCRLVAGHGGAHVCRHTDHRLDIFSF